MAFKTRESRLILIAAICVGAFVGDKIVLSPLVRLWKQRSERIVTLETSIEKGQALLDRQDAIGQRWDAMKSQALPRDKSAAEERVLQAVSRWTQVGRLTVNSLKPQWIDGEDKAKMSRRIECRVAAQGNLAALARFLYELESDPLAVRLEETEVASRDDAGQNLTVTIRFSGLVLEGETP